MEQPGRPDRRPALVEDLDVDVHLAVRFDGREIGDAHTSTTGKSHPGVTGDAVPVGRCGVAVHGTEVALTVDEGIAHHPRLGEPDHGVVDRRVTMGVVVLQHLADDRRALLVPRPRGHPLLEHRVEDATLHRLEPVADIRQGAADDDAHRIVHVARAHLVLELQRQDGTDVQWFHLDLYVDGLVVSCCQSV